MGNCRQGVSSLVGTLLLLSVLEVWTCVKIMEMMLCKCDISGVCDCVTVFVKVSVKEGMEGGKRERERGET